MSLFRINFELIYLKYILQMKRFFTFTLLLSFVSLALLSFPISQTKGEEEVYPGINEKDAGKFSDFEILSPKYGDVFSFEEDIDIQWKNKDTQKEYVYYVYTYFLEGQFHMGSTFTLTQDDGATIRPIEKGVVALQVYLFDKEFFWTEQRSEHTYVSEILVLGIGMDIPEYWYKRFYKEKEIEKMYFTISEVAKQFNVAASLIRFWETEFENKAHFRVSDSIAPAQLLDQIFYQNALAFLKEWYT